MSNSTASLGEIDWDFADSGKLKDLHTIHPYPAKFIAELPRALIKSLDLPENSWVLDPFCGSGVTLVEAQKNGMPAIGIDLNPIACLISRVKTQSLTSSIEQIALRALKSASRFTLSESHESIPNLAHWFKPEVSLRLSQIIQSIDSLALEGEVIDALRLAISSIIVRVSNQESDTRYAAVSNNLNISDVDRLFLSAAKKIDLNCIDQNQETEVKVINADITKVSRMDIDVPVGLVVTSPPYPAAYEYWLYHKYRMFWLGYDPISVRENEIGARPHYYRKKPASIEDFSAQMMQVSELVYSQMVSGGFYCIVIGNSKIHGKVYNNAELVMSVGKETGFTVADKIERTVASSRKSFNLAHARLKKETIVVLRKDSL
jgi:site-specific DNA-methyltransferase (cytosine-N4-specific)